MIEPWQVWLADLEPLAGHDQAGMRPVVVLSSEFHLRINVGRLVTVAPLTTRYRDLAYRVPVKNPYRSETSYVVTEQVRTLSTSRFEGTDCWWRLSDAEIRYVRRALSFMVEF